MHFALTLVRGPAWNDSIGIRDQVGWTEHAGFMDDLVADGFILFGGPVGDGQQTLHVVAADDANDVRRRHAEDPWARAGLLKIGSIQSWELWLDFRTNTASTERSGALSAPGASEPRRLPSGS